MKNLDYVIKNEKTLDKNISLAKIIGKKVISLGGKVVGKVSEVRVNPKSCAVEGIIISREVFTRSLYIGKSYFKRISEEAVLLNVELSLFLKGKIVMTSDGKKIGIVKEVIRVGNTNNLSELIVSSTFSKKFSIKPSDIKSLGKSVILKSGHDGKKKYFWQRNE